jgi:Ser/Thr protein kinase RdoA (MazF antagonist)
MVNAGFTEKYEELQLDLKKAVLRDYSLFENPEISLLKFSENIICRIDEKKGKKSAVLRINRPGYHDVPELENELKWITQINEQTDIHTAEVYQGVDGSVIQSFTSAGGKSYTYSMQSLLTGIPLRQIKGANLETQIKKVGNIAAKLHSMEEKTPHNKDSFNRFTWNIKDTLKEEARWGHFLSFEGMSAEEYHLFEKTGNKIEERLKNYKKSPQNYGLIHADLHSENLLVDDTRISLIDFDDCAYSWYLYDFASAVSQQSSGLKDMVLAYLEGYQEIRQLTSEDIDEIDTFLLLRRFVRLGWMTSHKDNGILESEGAEYFQVTKALAKNYLEGRTII